MAHQITIKIEARNIQWHAKQSDASKRWVAVCPPLNLAMEADSMEELRSLINEGMQLLFCDLFMDDELEAFLRERGWQSMPSPEQRERDGVEFDVPWELLVPGNTRDSQHQSH